MQRSTPTTMSDHISEKDILKLLADIDAQRKKLLATRKPVFFFVGPWGAGKSTIIFQLIRSRSREIPEDVKRRMNINEREEGTREPVVVEGDHLICVDFRGRRDGESNYEYKNAVAEGMQKKGIPEIDFFVGVIPADNNRPDHQRTCECLAILATTYERPFIVLMNRCDEIKDVPRHKERKAEVEKWCYAIKAPSKSVLKYLKRDSFCQGVFTCTAAPRQQLEPECPATLKKSEFHRHGVVMVANKTARYCKECNVLQVAAGAYKDTAVKKALEDLPPGTRTEPINIPPVGLGPSDEAMLAITGALADDSITCRVLKSLFEKEEQRLAAVPALIRRYAFVNRPDSAPKADRLICCAVAELFEVAETGIVHGAHESDRWEEFSAVWSTFAAPLNWLSKAFIDYERSNDWATLLGAWGIYYGLKYRAVARAVADAKARKVSQSDTIELCRRALNSISEEHVTEIRAYIKSEGLDKTVEMVRDS